jgi:hypothetical protein
MRRVPRLGDAVQIVHLAGWEAGEVIEVSDEGRRLLVHGHETDATSEFLLNQSTARFVSGGSQGPRLRWPAEGHEREQER